MQMCVGATRARMHGRTFTAVWKVRSPRLSVSDTILITFGPSRHARSVGWRSPLTWRRRAPSL